MPISKRVSLLLTFALLSLFMASACTSAPGTSSNSPGVIQVVAAENFYGNIFKQLGGTHVSVTSILSDPNADPHQYESSVQDALAVTKAQIVIENGEGYDTWMDKLLSASPNTNRTLLIAATIAPQPLADNPHVWYGINNIQSIAQSMTDALKKADGAHAAEFAGNLQTFKQSLAPLQQKIHEIKAKYAGTPVGLTETIYLYQTNPMGLRVLTPFEFEKAIAEGNDPPADTVVAANTQVSQHQIKALIYNEQTVTPITTNLQNEARQQHIPIIPVTETLPPGKTYQQWLLDQLNSLELALQGG